VAPFLAIESDTLPGTFSASNFLLLPFEPRTLEFVGRAEFDVADLEKSLTVLSLGSLHTQAVKTADPAALPSKGAIIVEEACAAATA
jgi:hypothetical protein